jgi:hypothetical protein
VITIKFGAGTKGLPLKQPSEDSGHTQCGGAAIEHGSMLWELPPPYCKSPSVMRTLDNDEH